MKVFGGTFDGTTRMIVAARSRTAAGKLMGISQHSAMQFMCETHNPQELQAALTKPGVVFSRPADFRDRLFVEGVISYRRGSPWPPEPAA